MKKLIALVAVVTMLFAMVGTASAYDVAMDVFVNPNLVQNGPSDYGWDGDLAVSYAPSNVWQFTNTMNISLSGKYSDLTTWYNYSNSMEQAAWVRIPIIFDSVDADDFPNVNTKSTQWTSGAGKLIQVGSSVTINGVMYPVAVIPGRGTANTGNGSTRYYSFWKDVDNQGGAGTATEGDVDTGIDDYITTDNIPGADGKNVAMAGGWSNRGATPHDAIGVMYPIRLLSGGMTEQLNISYTPNGVEVYKATINVTYYDTASGTNNAVIARETGDNAPYFNAKYTGGDTMAFDTVLKSGSMISKMEKFYYRGTGNGGTVEGDLYDDSDVQGDRSHYAEFYTISTTTAYQDKKAFVEFPTITMEAKVKLLDKNGNALPQRTQIRGSVPAGDGFAGNAQTHITNLTDLIVSDYAKVANNNYYLFEAGDVYSSTFNSATKTDDDYYLELDGSGEYTVTVRVIDNTSTLYKALLDAFISKALNNQNPYTIKPYAVTLENVETGSVMAGNPYVTIEGVKNRVNYAYLEDVEQNIYTYSMTDRQFLKYDIKLNSLDRIEASSFAISGNSSEMLAVGATRQLQATTGHSSSIITDANVNWKSSNPAVATVNATTGLVTAVADGTTYITASYAVGTGYDTVAVTVGTAPVATVAPVTPTTTQYFVAVGSSSSLNVRSGASTSSARVGRLKRGDTVNVYEIVDGWAKIDYNGSIAYVSSRYISQ